MMRRNRVIVLALLLAVGTVSLAMRRSTPSSPRSAGHGVRLQIPSTVKRLGLDPLNAPSLFRLDLSLSAIRGFVVLDGMVYVLDGQGGHVVVLKRASSGAWEESAVIGKRGKDAHDFLSPTGITTLPGDSGFAVIDGSRLLYFSKTGVPGRIRTLQLRCHPHRPAVALGPAEAVFIADDCQEDGMAKAVLSWSPDGVEKFAILAKAPKFALDGSSGSVYTGPRSMTDAGDHILFGVGLTACVIVIEKRATAPQAPLHRECVDSSDALSAPPPAEITSRVGAVRKAGRKVGRAWEWPDPMPYYAASVTLPGGHAIVRTVSAESMFVQSLVPGARHMLVVAPGNGFKGCDRDACFWLANVRGELRMALYVTPSENALTTEQRR
jgi:hypothetical protein